MGKLRTGGGKKKGKPQELEQDVGLTVLPRYWTASGHQTSR